MNIFEEQSKGMTHVDIVLTKKKKEPLQKGDDDVCLEFCRQPNNIALLTFQ